MTAFNREKYIAEAIESVLHQTFRDFELIIVDDGSTDGTVAIARRYTSDPRVRFFQNKKNLGDYPNRNRAAALAQGRYFKYLDSDDVLYPFGLAAMVDMMLRHPAAVLGLQRPSLKDKPFPLLLSPAEAYWEHFLGGGLFGVGPTGTIILTAAFRAAGGFSGKRFIGDSELWLKLAAQHPIMKFMEGLVWWRSHSDQEIAAGYHSLGQATLEYMVHLEALGSSGCPLTAAQCIKALNWLKYRHARFILRTMLLDRRIRRATHIMRETGFGISDLRRAFSRQGR